MSPEECDAIIAASKDNLIKSLVENDNGVKGSKESKGRVSEQAWIPGENPVVKTIVKKTLDITGLPRSHFERSVQVVRYGPQGKYDPHYDSCDMTKADKTCLEKNPRRWTVLVYLNDDYKCGGTRFPRLNYTTKPEKGKALVFRVSDEQGLLFEDALHGGDPVCEGEKWIATQWVRMAPYS